jgi:hypothetical protein
MIWSVGHSNHSIERFIEILKESGIESVVDFRWTNVGLGRLVNP